MKRFKITVMAENEEALTTVLASLVTLGNITSIYCSDITRDKEIVDKYVSDPKLHSSQKLADEYGITRERVYQILRQENVIAHAAERRQLAREAIDAVGEQFKAEERELWDAKLEEALVLVRDGLSCRKAAAAVGMVSHSHFTNTLSQRARNAGVPSIWGRHRDFSARHARAQALHAQGCSIPQIVKIMREEGDRISSIWMYQHYPQFKRPWIKLPKNST